MVVAAQLNRLAEAPEPLLGRRGGRDRRRGRQRPTRLGTRQLGQPGRLVDRLADYRVLESLIRTDVAGNHLPGRHPDSGRTLGHFAGQPPRDRPDGRQRIILRVIQGYRRAEDREGRVALELVHESVVAVDFLDDHPEETVEQVDDLHWRSGADQLGRTDDVDEDHGNVAYFAAQRGPLLLGRGRYLAPHMFAEQIAHPFALAQARGHRVESPLKLAEFGAVEHHHAGIEVTLLDPAQRRSHHPHRRRRQPGQDPRQKESDDEAGCRGDQDRDLELAPTEVVQQQREQGDQADADHRHARAQRPHR